MMNYKVTAIDHFDWPPEEYPAGVFSTREEAEQKAAEIERTPMQTARVEPHPFCK
jgi:hypothetical protein